MNLLTITMDKDRSLTPSLYSLGVEGDHKIDKIVLVTPKVWEGTDVSKADVAIHVMTENGYFHNSVCAEREIDGELVRFFFPITREMTCRCGKLKIEFSFSDAPLGFSFTSRTAELFVADSLTNGEEIESDYPGLLWDVMNSVEGFSSRLESTESSVDELEKSVDSLADINAFIGYNDEEILGLEADFENSVFTRLAGARGLEAGADFDSFLMYQRRRCNVSDNGEIVAFYGDEEYREDTTNGQVMVYQPKFYYRVVPTKLEKIEDGFGYHIRKANYYISAKPKPFFKLHPAFIDSDGNELNYILYSAYEGSMWDASKGVYANDGTDTSTELDLVNDRLCSVSGVKPISGKYKKLTRANLEALATARGEGWHIETIQAASANQLLMLIELGSTNFQPIIGNGVVSVSNTASYNGASITGSTSALGNITGKATATTSEVGGVEVVYTDKCLSISYRGMENPYSNIWKFVEGINIWGDGTMGGGQAYITDKTTFTESVRSGDYEAVGFSLPSSRLGYATALGYGKEKFDWLFIGSEIAAGGDSNFPIGDAISCEPNLNAYAVACIGNNWTGGYSAGGFCWHLYYNPAVTIYTAGARLLYLPSSTKGGVL